MLTTTLNMIHNDAEAATQYAARCADARAAARAAAAHADAAAVRRSARLKQKNKLLELLDKGK